MVGSVCASEFQMVPVENIGTRMKRELMDPTESYAPHLSKRHMGFSSLNGLGDYRPSERNSNSADLPPQLAASGDQPTYLIQS